MIEGMIYDQIAGDMHDVCEKKAGEIKILS